MSYRVACFVADLHVFKETFWHAPSYVLNTQQAHVCARIGPFYRVTLLANARRKNIIAAALLREREREARPSSSLLYTVHHSFMLYWRPA